jgi:hypothetical protein
MGDQCRQQSLLQLPFYSATMPQDNEGYILYPAGYPESKIRRIHSRKSHSGPNHAFMYKGETSSSRQPTRAKLPKKTPIASNDHDISFKTFDTKTPMHYGHIGAD